jgi:hypothetical protein
MDSEDPFLMPMDATLTDSVLLVLSHIFIFIAIINALYRRLFYITSALTIMFMNSVLYHMCRANWTCGLYGTPLIYDSSSFALYRTRVVDHASANHAVVAMLFAVLTSDPAGGPTVGGLRLLLLAGTFASELAFPLKTIALVLAFAWLGSVNLIYTWISIKGRLPDGNRFGLGLIALAIVFLGAGYALFLLVTIPYGYAHSAWHLAVGLSVLFISEGIHVGRGGRSWVEFSCKGKPTPSGII